MITSAHFDENIFCVIIDDTEFVTGEDYEITITLTPESDPTDPSDAPDIWGP